MNRPRPRRTRRESIVPQSETVEYAALRERVVPQSETVEYAALRERVASLDEDVHAISGDVAHLRNTMATKSDVNNVHAALTNFSQTVQGSFTAINDKLANQGKPQWNLYIMAASLMVAVMVTLGGVAYFPIKQAQDGLSGDIQRVREQIVPRVEHVERWRQSERQTDRLERRIDEMDKDSREGLRGLVAALRARLRAAERQADRAEDKL